MADPVSSAVVMVADDEESVCNMIAAIIRSHGYHAITARDGIEALDLSRRHSGDIDLLISDIVMPGMSGLDLAQVLVKERPKTKVLLISGLIPDAPLKLDLPPAFDFLRKPFTTAALREAMGRLLSPRTVTSLGR